VPLACEHYLVKFGCGFESLESLRLRERRSGCGCSRPLSWRSTLWLALRYYVDDRGFQVVEGRLHVWNGSSARMEIRYFIIYNLYLHYMVFRVPLPRVGRPTCVERAGELQACPAQHNSPCHAESDRTSHGWRNNDISI